MTGRADIIRPKWHFALKKGWLNDPNGLVWFKGEYHLYFQCNPYGNEWAMMHWGHARSKDLIHWEECGAALLPEKEYELWQRGGCFSGSLIVYKERLYAFYTAVSSRDGESFQTQCMAYSDDGCHFERAAENPLIGRCPCPDSHDFRDPKVIYHNGRWQMLCGGSSGDAEDRRSHGRIYLFHSEDLLHWDYDGILYEAKDGEGSMFECPDIFPLGDHWVITASPMNRTDFQSTIYMTGMVNFKNCIFYVENSGTLDFGPHYYASQVYRDRYGRLISMAWLGGWEWMPWIRDHGPSEEDGYRGVLSYPRLLSEARDGALKMRPYSDIDDAAREEGELIRKIARGTSAELFRGEEPVRIRGSIERSMGTNLIQFRFMDEDSHCIRVCLDFLFGSISTDFTEADPWIKNGRKLYKAEIGGENEIPFELIRDGNVLELFLFDGRYAVSSMIYPSGGKFRLLIGNKGAGIKLRYSISGS